MRTDEGPPKVSGGVTTTSMPALASRWMSAKARAIWSVSTKVPETIATPSRMASAVSAERSLRWASPRRASGSIRSYLRRGP
ncbi:MAG: hypothetical protein AVDCRST_MAG65-1852 [uncultured Solirubrobacteraceae bacterium]|uniref:Uncharacterized protein n=1 Tax=uncultured Solirubrobacteraceae bacterium TaxID=1162706 RepID=A0A6J4S8N1_9ACTN|nr:MAG: hypothetical protein AVDCRST_MAG65-1852 [uncultured Solirubrobacteraceae bacterium]